MRWISRVRLAVCDLVRRDELKRQIHEAPRASVERDAGSRLRQGDAREEALGAGHVLQTIGQDLRFGVRVLRRHPGFAAAVIVTIAIGIGPLTIVLGLANWLFVRPVPGVKDRGDLVQVEFVTRSARGGIGTASVSYANYHELMSSFRVFDGLAGEATTTLSVAAANAGARLISAGFVMHDYFDVLGVSLQRGRTFTANEDREPDGAPVAILSHKLATGLFGDSEHALGRQIHINGLPFTTVGVVPQAFTGLQPGVPVELWITGATWSQVSHVPTERRNRGRANGLFNVFVGRLARNVTFEQAKSELTRATRHLAEVDPNNKKFTTAEVWMEKRPGLPIRLRPQAAELLGILGMVGALLLLIAAANVSNLLLFHGVRRRHEVALRLALGATRWRLIRAHLLDSALLGLMGSVGGLLLALWAVQLFEGFLLPGIGTVSVPVNWRVIGQATVVSVGVACIFGVLPAIVASRPNAAVVLGSAAAAVTRRGRYIRSGLTAIQLGLSLTLLIGALLLVSTMRNLRGVDTGTDPSRVTALFLDLGAHGYSAERARAFFARFLEHATGTTAADAVGIGSRAPFFGGTTMARVHRPSDDGSQPIEVASNGVTPGYFAALRIPLLRGRVFTESEAFAAGDGTCGPVIVSQLLARRLFADQDPLGGEIRLARKLDCAIVGVVGDVRWSGPGSEPEPMLYRPLAREPLAATSVAILARSAQPSAQVAAALRKAAASLDPTVPVSAERRLADVIESRMADRRLTSAMLTLLAIMGFVLAAVGLYALVAETVAERRREFGIRMAVGADPARIFRTVVSGAGWIALAGIVTGVAAAAVVGRALQAQLFGVALFEPAVYLMSIALLVLVVVLASLIPARTATRVDPVAALRGE